MIVSPNYRLLEEPMPYLALVATWGRSKAAGGLLSTSHLPLRCSLVSMLKVVNMLLCLAGGANVGPYAAPSNGVIGSFVPFCSRNQHGRSTPVPSQ